jgi:stage IV sporulation protein A
VPSEAVEVNLSDMVAKVRLVDCVGYLVDGALGHMEADKERLVKTPWQDEEMPFQRAAEMGTNKVINEHSTIGILVTTDGSFTGIPRGSYIPAEERVIKELKAIGKPFVILLNTTKPQDPDTIKLAQSLEERHNVATIAIDIQKAGREELSYIMQCVLNEFPVRLININIPRWMRALDIDHAILKELIVPLSDNSLNLAKMSDYRKLEKLVEDSAFFAGSPDLVVDSAVGAISLNFTAREGLFLEVLSKECGCDINDDYKLMAYVKRLSKSYHEYEQIRSAMEEVKTTGYGVVNPTLADMELMQPEMVRKGAQYGIKLRAIAPSLHIVRVDVETEVSPMIGSEKQSEDLVTYLLGEYERDKQALWDSKLFGKSLSSMAQENLANKINAMPEDARIKLKKTIGRIINEGKGGVLCILL